MLRIFLFTTLVSLACSVNAGMDDFRKGPVFANYGENVAIENTLDNAKSQHFKVLFDISKAGDEGQVNKHFNTVARFINMHVRAGVPKENIDVAMVIHGKAGLDLLSKRAYQTRLDATNPNEELVRLLLKAKVQIVICGQSASYYGIVKSDLPTGIDMSLSAMTAHALFQQQGYTLNPF